MNEAAMCDAKKVAFLFEGWEETMVWSCLEGVMGKAWAVPSPSPQAACIAIGDFLFFAGDACSPEAEVLALAKPWKQKKNPLLAIPQTEAWERLLLSCHGSLAKKSARYATKKEGDIFSREKLQGFRAALPSGFHLSPITPAAYRIMGKESWAQDFCSQFSSYEDYKKRGLGFFAWQGQELAAGASSYTIYSQGIEIEIDTKPEYRRKGLALACASALILRCLEQGLYPSWDAANQASISLAQKLGYRFSHEYSCIELTF